MGPLFLCLAKRRGESSRVTLGRHLWVSTLQEVAAMLAAGATHLQVLNNRWPSLETWCKLDGYPDTNEVVELKMFNCSLFISFLDLFCKDPVIWSFHLNRVRHTHQSNLHELCRQKVGSCDMHPWKWGMSASRITGMFRLSRFSLFHL